MRRKNKKVARKTAEENSGKSTAKKFTLQSAMEYLMTYGWAILIIAVVLSVLFYLGVFNPLTFAPRQQPGSCQVIRPNGAGTNLEVNLAGECSGIPEYVVNINGKSVAYISTKTNLEALNSITIVWWMYENSINPSGAGIGPSGCQVYWPASSGATFSTFWDPCTCSGYSVCSSYAGLTLNKATWYMVAYTVNGAAVNSYAYSNAGVQTATGTLPSSITIPSEIFYIGNYDGQLNLYSFLNGSVANVQVYNTVLSQNDIQTLYQEGIGGAPFALQNLVAWWPLNGNANDYSGNGNNGQTLNVSYSNTWINGYTPP